MMTCLTDVDICQSEVLITGFRAKLSRENPGGSGHDYPLQKHRCLLDGAPVQPEAHLRMVLHFGLIAGIIFAFESNRKLYRIPNLRNATNKSSLLTCVSADESPY